MYLRTFKFTVNVVYNWPRICYVCRSHNPVLSSFMNYHRVCNKSNTTGATSGAGTAYPFGTPEFIPGFNGVRVSQSLVFWVVFCRSLLVFFFSAIAMFVLWITASFWLSLGIFKFFLSLSSNCFYIKITHLFKKK